MRVIKKKNSKDTTIIRTHVNFRAAQKTVGKPWQIRSGQMHDETYLMSDVPTNATSQIQIRQAEHACKLLEKKTRGPNWSCVLKSPPMTTCCDRAVWFWRHSSPSLRHAIPCSMSKSTCEVSYIIKPSANRMFVNRRLVIPGVCRWHGALCMIVPVFFKWLAPSCTHNYMLETLNFTNVCSTSTTICWLQIHSDVTPCLKCCRRAAICPNRELETHCAIGHQI